MADVLRALPAHLSRGSCPFEIDKQFDIILSTEPIYMYFTPFESYGTGESNEESTVRNGQDLTFLRPKHFGGDR